MAVPRIGTYAIISYGYHPPGGTARQV